MNFSDVFVDSLRYPFSNIKRLLIFFVLTLGNVLIFPIVFSGGYLIRIIESTLEGSDELPEFTDLKKLIIDGLKFVLVSIIYGLPVGAVTLITAFMVPQAVIGLWITTIVAIIAVFLVNILLFMGLTNMVYEKTLDGAFRFRKIIQLIKTVGWKKYLSYLIALTILTEGLSIFYAWIIPQYLMGSFPDIYLGYLISGAVLVNMIISGLFKTYISAFNGRLRGLIYPINKESNPELHDEH